MPATWLPSGVTVQGPVAASGPPISVKVWEPTPKQSVFLNCPITEVFFGGAKGGGKSNSLIADFAMHERAYGGSARGILFRRTLGEFQHLQEMANSMYAGLARWVPSISSYVWPSGARLRLAYLERESDLGRYTGNQYSWIGFDEVTEWAGPLCYTWMFSCLRSPDPRVNCVMRATGNPGRPGHGWVKARFIDPVDPGDVYRDPDTGVERCFIPARLEDNPHLAENDPGYEQRLHASSDDPNVIRALRWGVWDVFVGQALADWNQRRHVIAPCKLDPRWPRVVVADWGFAKPFCFLYFAIAPNGRVFLYRENYGCVPGKPDTGVKRHAFEVAKEEYDYASGYGISNIIVDGSVKDQTGSGSTVGDQFQMAGWALEPANKQRIEGKNAVHRLLQTELSDGRPMLQVFDSCRGLIRTLPTLIYNDRVHGKQEDVDDHGEDHPYDALRYFAMRHDLMPNSPRLHRRMERARSEAPQRAPDWNPYDVQKSNWNPYGCDRLAA